MALQKKDLSKAERMSGDAVKQEPDNPTYLDTYAWVFFQQGNYTLAKIYLKSALDKGGNESAALLEHYGWRWIMHRPEESMFKKQMVCIATAAGGGQKNTCQDMADSAAYWGVAKTYKYGIAVRAMKWEDVTAKTKDKIERDMDALASKIKANQGRVKPPLKTRIFFPVMSMVLKMRPDSVDAKYWKEKGWLDGKRPWK